MLNNSVKYLINVSTYICGFLPPGNQTFTSQYCIKLVSHAISGHVLNGANPCINKAIHVLLIHSFTILHNKHSRAVTKFDVIINNVDSMKRKFVTLK